MTREKSATASSKKSSEQQERADLVLAYVEMAQECENKHDEEGAEFLLRGANDALIDLLNNDSV